MASAAKKLLKELRKVELSSDSPADIGEMELLVLIVLSAKAGRDPKKLAKALGLSGRRVQNAWNRLREKGLIAPSEETTSDPQPICEATEAGRNIAGYALIATELADFEPELLSSLRADELKAPFPRADKPGGL
jgi:DNA-binding MarR family transcriptional regulator